jgi:TPP-dependent 2-oxoacid decarboxylase
MATDKTTRQQAEEILKSKLDPKIAIINNPDYTFNKIIEAMEEHASNAYEKGLKDGYDCMPKNIKSPYEK